MFDLKVPPTLDLLTLDETLRQNIIDFTTTNSDLFTFNGDGRRYCNVNNIQCDLSTEIQNFAIECYAKYGVQYQEESRLGNFIGFNDIGANVQKHNDVRSIDNLVQVRLLFMVSKPSAGGIPVIEGTEISVNEKQVWLLLASEWQHWSTPVEGTTPRIILSLGSYVPEQDISKFYI